MQRATGGATMQVVRGRIRNVWTALDDADIERAGGSFEKLVTMISAKTGQPRADVRRELRRIFTE